VKITKQNFNQIVFWCEGYVDGFANIRNKYVMRQQYHYRQGMAKGFSDLARSKNGDRAYYKNFEAGKFEVVV
jgi:hypothetical protein